MRDITSVKNLWVFFSVLFFRDASRMTTLRGASAFSYRGANPLILRLLTSDFGLLFLIDLAILSTGLQTALYRPVYLHSPTFRIPGTNFSP